MSASRSAWMVIGLIGGSTIGVSSSFFGPTVLGTVPAAGLGWVSGSRLPPVAGRTLPGGVTCVEFAGAVVSAGTIGVVGWITGPDEAAGAAGAWSGMMTGPDGAGGTTWESPGAGAVLAAGGVVESLQAASVSVRNKAARRDAWRRGRNCDRDVICLGEIKAGSIKADSITGLVLQDKDEAVRG